MFEKDPLARFHKRQKIKRRNIGRQNIKKALRIRKLNLKIVKTQNDLFQMRLLGRVLEIRRLERNLKLQRERLVKLLDEKE